MDMSGFIYDTKTGEQIAWISYDKEKDKNEVVSVVTKRPWATVDKHGSFYFLDGRLVPNMNLALLHGDTEAHPKAVARFKKLASEN